MILYLLSEIQEQVFTYSSIDDIKNLSLTNSSYNLALKPFLFHTVEIQWKDLVEDNVTSDTRLPYLNYTKQLCFDDRKCILQSSNESDERKEAMITKNFDKILEYCTPRKLEFLNSTIPEEILHSASCLQDLRGLKIISCSNLGGFNLNTLLSNMQSLKTLSIEMCGIHWNGLSEVGKLISLRELSLSRCHRLTNWGLSFISGLSSLRRLNISFNPHITDEGMLLLENLTHIEELDIGSCVHLTDESLRFISTVMSSLRSLNASACTYITDTGIYQLTKLEKLEKLSLLGLYRTTKLSMFYIKNSFALTLRCLQVPGWGGIKMKGLPKQYLSYVSCLTLLEELVLGPSCGDQVHDLQFLTSLKRLKKLDLSYLTSLSAEGLSYLYKLPLLEDLTMVYSIHSDESLLQIAGVTSLRKLDIGGLVAEDDVHISDQAFQHLKQLTRLEELRLSRWLLNEAKMACIGQMVSLKKLCLKGKGHTSITADSDLQKLQSLPMLEELDLYGNRHLTDKGLKHVSALKSLRRLNIGGCANLSNQGFAYLKNLPSLKVLGVTQGVGPLGVIAGENCCHDELRTLKNVRLVHSQHF